MEIIQITDLHITRDMDFEKNNCRPFHKLKQTLDAIAANHRDDLYLVITGDLSGDDSKESYDHIRGLLKNYSFNVTLLPGNHDNPEFMKSICDSQISFGVPPQLNKSYAFFNFNTQVDGQVGGCIKKSQIDDFSHELHDQVKNIILFTHHPITKINSKWIDKHVASNSNFLIDLMHSHNDLEFNVFSGHVHQEFSKVMKNVKVFTTPSTCYQFKPYSDEYSIDTKSSNGYRVINLRDNTVSTHVVRL
tara:strand:- start:1060 stop:1800 length:741 start_codon:yes stop_codon:yes gene_type:complete